MGAGDIFPLTPDFVYEAGDKWRTLVSEFESGKEQRRSMWSKQLAQFIVRKKAVSKTDIQSLRSFFNARKGSLDYFWFDNPDDNKVTNEAIGTGNGAATVFNLAKYPVKTAAGTFEMRVNGIPASATLSNDNVNFIGKATFAAPPASGASITGDYQFYYPVRFLEDLLIREMIAFQLYDFSTRLQEVRL